MASGWVHWWLNRVLDTAEDYRLLHALPKFLEALREMSPDTWRSCLHVSNFPVPRAVWDVDDAILDWADRRPPPPPRPVGFRGT